MSLPRWIRSAGFSMSCISAHALAARRATSIIDDLHTEKIGGLRLFAATAFAARLFDLGYRRRDLFGDRERSAETRGSLCPWHAHLTEDQIAFHRGNDEGRVD